MTQSCRSTYRAFRTDGTLPRYDATLSKSLNLGVVVAQFLQNLPGLLAKEWCGSAYETRRFGKSNAMPGFPDLSGLGMSVAHDAAIF